MRGVPACNLFGCIAAIQEKRVVPSPVGQTANQTGLINTTAVALTGRADFMTRVTRLSWTSHQISQLFSLIEKGVSPARASVVLGRRKLAVQNKARQLGRPFPDAREVKAARLAREVGELEEIRQTGRASSKRVDAAQT